MTKREVTVEERARKVCDKLGTVPHTGKPYEGICFVCQYTADELRAAIDAQKEKDARFIECLAEQDGKLINNRSAIAAAIRAGRWEAGGDES